MAGFGVLPGFPFAVSITETTSRFGMLPGISVTETSGNVTYTLSVDQATLTFAAQAVTFNSIRNLSVAQATLSFTPQAVTVRAARNLSVATATLSFTPQAVTFRTARNLSVATATLSFSPQSVTFQSVRNLTIDPTTLSFNMQQVTIIGPGGTAQFTVSGALVEGQFPHKGISLVDDVSFPYHTQQRTN